MSALNRRQFLKTSTALSVTAAITAKTGASFAKSNPPSATPTLTLAQTCDAAPLPGPLHDLLTKHPVHLKSDLDQLPWFEKTETGDIRLKSETGLPPVIDVHTHLGWSFGIGTPVDMTQRSEVEYFFDYNTPQDFLQFQAHPTPQETKSMSRETGAILLKTPDRNKTHTAANLLADMQSFNYHRSVLLPIEIPYSHRHSDVSIQAASTDERLIAFMGLHPFPWNDKKITLAQQRIKDGACGLKFHPEFQFIPPDAPESMKLFDWCAENQVPVLAHTGYTGREPAFMRGFAEPERFVPALKAFKKLNIVFAHTGSRQCLESALSVAGQYDSQVWLDFSGQPVPAIQRIFDQYSHDKILYGSDWPYYPLAVSLARFLVATEGQDNLRQAILHDNPKRLLKLA